MRVRAAVALLAWVAAVPAVAAPSLRDTRHAIEVGRLDQARDMLATMIQQGARGAAIERLLGDLAMAKGDNRLALAHYQWLLGQRPDDGTLLESAGIAALRDGDVATGYAYLVKATSDHRAGVDWRAWNALGVASDRRGDFDVAAANYAEAARRAAGARPALARIANNRGWSLMLQGRWAAAKAEFDRAVAGDPTLPHLAANRELAAAALSAELPRRSAGEDDAAFAARLNDAGVVAAASGDKARAGAAFARAIAARRTWDRRAAANLATLDPPPVN